MSKTEAPPPTVSNEPPVAVVNSPELLRKRHEEKWLPVPLTVSEKLELGEKIVAASTEIEAVELELAQAKLVAKEKLERLNGSRAEHIGTLRRGSVDRQIEVLIEMDFEHRRVSLTRLDTGEVYQERDMTYQELQTQLKLA